MGRKIRKILSGLFAAVMLAAMVAGIFVAFPTESGAAEKTIRLEYPDFDGKMLQWDFPYSDDFFKEDSKNFSIEMARATMGLTISAFGHLEKDLSELHKAYLEGAGFNDVYSFGYELETSKDTLAGIIGWKKIDDFILIAAAPRGQGYGKEWGGNLEVGDEERHVGFNNAAAKFEDEINRYIEANGLTGAKKLWLGGFSRAAATSNITAADMIDSGKFEDVYAYLVATPRTTKNEDHGNYKGIYNICGKNDPVTKIPLQSWGFERYGMDLYTPSLNADVNFISLALGANDVCLQLTGKLFYYNPEISHQLNLIIEFLGVMFKTNAEYADKFQDILMEVWAESNPDMMFTILAAAVEQLKITDKREEYASDVLIDYLTFIASQHMKEEKSQVNLGYWNPDVGIAENVIREHIPYTYTSWLFSDNPLDSLLYGPYKSREVLIFGDIDVEVYKDGEFISGMDSKGRFIFNELSEDMDHINEEEIRKLLRDVFILRTGNETLVSLPVDGNYRIDIANHSVYPVIYYDIIRIPQNTYGKTEAMYGALMDKGKYSINVGAEDEQLTLTAVDGNIRSFSRAELDYSPVTVMADESLSSDHMTISGLVLLIIGVIIVLLIMLFICLVIAIVHKIKKKKRGRPYSPWFVIVPHLILILIFTLVTQYFAYNMFVIGQTREVAAGITMLLIFLLALRGLIRNRTKLNLFITIGILAAGFVNALIYQRSSLMSSSALGFAFYFLAIALLTLLAISTFFKDRTLLFKKRSEGGQAVP